MKTNIAIDVGSSFVKVIEGCEKKGRILIKKVASWPNPYPAIKEELNEREHDSFVKSLKSSLRKASISSKSCISSISGNGTIIHYFDIPNLPENEIKPTVHLEIMQVTSGGTRNFEYDYTIFPEKKNKKTILFIGYPRDKCAFYVKALQRAGLKPLVMDHDSLAVLNAYRFFHREKKPDPLFMLNIGSMHSNFALQEQGGFALIRDIPYGEKHIIRVIAAKKSISEEAAEIYCRRKDNAGDLKSIISDDLTELLDEIKAGTEYFRVKTERYPETLFLTGGGSHLPGIPDALSHSLGIEVMLWNPFEEVSKKISIPQETRQAGPAFAVAMGLMLRKIQ